MSRGGLAFVGRCKQNPPFPPRPIPFQFSITQGYVLEFGEHYIRFVFQGGYVLENPVAITGVTNADPGVVSVTGTPFANGDWVYITDVNGMPLLNGETYIVAGVASGHFSLQDLNGNNLDTTAYGTYVSGGTARRIYTISSPYLAEDLPYLKYAQSADVMSLTCSNPLTGNEYAPYNLTRLSAIDWTLVAIDFSAAVSPPATVSAAANAQAPSNGINATFAYVVTAVDRAGNESVASAIATCHGADLEVEAGTNTITWSVVSGAKYYNVYRSPASVDTGSTPQPVPAGSFFGFIGSAFGTQLIDTRSVTDLTQVPPVHTEPFAPGRILAVDITSGGSGQTALSYAITTSAGVNFAGYPILTSGALGGFIITNSGEHYAPGDTIAFNGAGFASGAIEFGSTNPTVGDTVTLNGVVWTFVSAITGPQQTIVGGALSETLTQLASDLSASTNASLTVASYAVASAASNLLVTYRTAGTGGNAYTLAASRATPSGATLTGGSGSGSTGAHATGNITFSINPTAAQNIVLNGITWTFVASGATGNQTNLAGTLAGTLTQLASDLNASGVTGIAAATYTGTSTQLQISYDAIGSIGNTYTLSAGTTTATPSGASLQGGSDASSTPSATLEVGPTTGAYPGVNTYFQQRHFFANSLNQPDTFWASQTGLFKNFDTAIPVVATDAITASPWTEQVNGIQWLIPMPGGLIALTGNRAWQIVGEGSYNLNVQPITPSSTQAQPQAFNGANAIVPPVVIDYDVLYVEAIATVVRDMAWNVFTNIYTGADLTILSAHLFLYRQILQWAWARQPYKTLWCACDDGTMLVLTYLKEQQVWGWTRCDTQGLVVGIASITEPPVNAVYAVVQRFPPGVGGSLRYTLTPYQPFSGMVQSLIETSDSSLYTAQSSQQYMGHSYDPVSGQLFFSSNVLVDSVATGSAFDKINNTGHTFYDVSANTSVAPAAHYDGSYLKNFFLHRLDTTTGAVTMVDVFDPAAVIPNGIHGSDGTWRMVVVSGASNPEAPAQFKLVDPRTTDCWAHMTSPECNIYVFRSGEAYKQQLLPFGVNGHMEMLGITDDWLLVMHSNVGATPRDNGQLYTVPRLTTSDETANGQLLGYFVETQDTWMDTAYWRTILTPDGALYIFGNQRTGMRDYRLFRYDPPASVGSWMGSPQAGGTFTDITPWSGSTGPNTDCAAWTFDGTGGANNGDRVLRWKQNSPYSLPATNQLAWLSILAPQNTVTAGNNHDPANFRVDCTYYDIDGATFDYHEGFVGGYMTSAWTVTAVPGDAAFAPQFIRETDTFREMNAYDYGDDYTERWIEFSVQPVVGGTFTWGSGPNHNFAVLVKYRFAYGSPPEVIDVRVDSSWLPFYETYATAIDNNYVVEQSILMNGGFDNVEFTSGGETYLADTGFVTSTGIWFGGWNGAGNFRQSININPAFSQYRGTWTDFDPYPLPAAVVRISWGDSGPGAYFMERLDNRLWQTTEDAYAVDSGVSNPMSSPATPLSASAATGTGITFASVSGVFSAASVGQIIRMGGGIAEVTGYTNPTLVTGDWVLDASNGAPGFPYAAAGTWTIATPVNSLRATHLAGLTVNALADGVPVLDLTVADDGVITLPFAASNVKAGLSFTAQAQTPYLNGQNVVQGARKEITAATVRMSSTANSFQYGVNQPDGGAQNPQQLAPAWSDLTTVDLTQMTGGQAPPATYTTPGGATATQLWTGDYRVVGAGDDWNSKGQVAIQQTLPVALEITLVAPETLPGDVPEVTYRQESGRGEASQQPNGPHRGMIGPRI
jgi:hypothetical protein